MMEKDIKKKYVCVRSFCLGEDAEEDPTFNMIIKENEIYEIEEVIRKTRTKRLDGTRVYSNLYRIIFSEKQLYEFCLANPQMKFPTYLFIKPQEMSNFITIRDNNLNELSK